MPAPPFFATPNGWGEATASITNSVTVTDVSIVVQKGDLLRIALSSDDTVDATGIVASGFSAFVRRAFGSTTIGENAFLSVWYATATSGQTGFSATASWASNFDDACANWALIRGASPTAPNDPDATLPGVETGAPPSAVTFNTTNANDLVFFSFAGDNGMWNRPPPQTVTPSPPWTYLVGAGNTGGFGAATLGTYYQTATSPLSGSTAANDIPLTDGAIFIVDAITGASEARPFLIRPNRMLPKPARPFLIRPNRRLPLPVRPFLIRPTKAPAIRPRRPFLLRPTTGPAPPPGVPIDESCGPATQTSITPTWVRGAGGAPATYTLQWRPPGGSFTRITGVAATSQQITGLIPDTDYEWQVQAVNVAGVSGFSASFFCSTAATFKQAFDLILSVSRDSGAYIVSQESRSFNISRAPRPTAVELFNTGAIFVFQTSINVANAPNAVCTLAFTAPDGSTLTFTSPDVYVGRRYLPTPVGVLQRETYVVYVFGKHVLIRGRWRFTLSFVPHPQSPPITDYGSFHVPQHPPRYV